MTLPFHPFTKDDVKIKEREVRYQGVFRLVRYQLQHRLFNGGWSGDIYREVFERKSAAALLPYDPVLDRIVLIEQIRAGTLASPHAHPWLIEIVAGVFGDQEQAQQVAIREAKEEANCDVQELLPIYEYFVSPGGSNEYIHIYCGRVDSSQAEGIFGLPEENEDIRAFSVSSEQAFQLLADGHIKNAPSIIAIQWLQLNRERLRQLWQTK